MSLADAYKTLGGHKRDLVGREMTRKSVLGATKFAGEALDTLSKVAGDYATDQTDLLAGEKLVKSSGYDVYDATPGSNWNPKNWGGYTVKNKEGQVLNAPKESLRNLGGLGRSAEFVGQDSEKVTTAWEKLQQFNDPNASPVAKNKNDGSMAGVDDREVPSKSIDYSRNDWGKESKWGNWWDKNKPKTGEFYTNFPNLPKIDWSKLKDFSIMGALGYTRTETKVAPNWRESNTKYSGNRTR